MNLTRVNPAIRVLGGLVISLSLLISLDPISGLTVAGSLALLMLITRTNPGLWRSVAILTASAFTFIAAALYGRIGGEVFLRWGIVVVSQDSLYLGFTLAVRVLALALSVIWVFYRLELTDLADGLVQRLRLPYRLVFASLAAFSLAGQFLEDWRQLGYARRVRGCPDGFGSRLYRVSRSGFNLLVIALRRASRLAAAMEVRGLGSGGKRSWARVSRLCWGDGVYILVCLAVIALAQLAAVEAGAWRFFLS